MKVKLKPKKKIGRPMRVLAYNANGIYIRSFDNMQEANQWDLSNRGHWYEFDGTPMADPDIKFVTIYCDEENENDITKRNSL